MNINYEKFKEKKFKTMKIQKKTVLKILLEQYDE